MLVACFRQRYPPVVRCIALIVLLFVTAATQFAAADDGKDAVILHPYLKNGVFIDAGVFLARRDVKLSVNGSAGDPDDTYSFKETFDGGDDDNALALELGWRYGKAWSLNAQYFSFSGASEVSLREEVEFKDEVFPIGADVNFSSSLSVTRIFFGRQFKATRDRAEFGVGGGIHWLSISTSLAGEARIGIGINEFRSESARAEGPLPNIGLWYRYSVTPRLAFRTRLDWLEASIDRYDGKLINVGIGLNYQFIDWLGGGINYNYFEFDAGIRDNDWRGSIDSEYSGIFVNLSGFF